MIYEIFKGFVITAQDESDLEAKRNKISNGATKGFAYIGSNQEKLDQFCNKNKIDISLFGAIDEIEKACIEDEISIRETMKDITDG